MLPITYTMRKKGVLVSAL